MTDITIPIPGDGQVPFSDGKQFASGAIYKLYFEPEAVWPSDAEIAELIGAVKVQKITEQSGVARVAPSNK